MKPVSMALEAALDHCLTIPTVAEFEKVCVGDARNRVCAADIHAPADIPGFYRSLVDGYAVTKSDWNLIKSGLPVKLQLNGEIAAGEILATPLSSGYTTRVMTGAHLPPLSAAVLKQEDVYRVRDGIIIQELVLGKKNIQTPDSVVKAEEVITSKGELLTPSHTERLASAGIVEILVYRRPVIHIINTGTELVQLGQSLPPGKIYNSNCVLLKGLVEEAYGRARVELSAVPDNLEALCREMEIGWSDSDLLLISGGTAEGKYDLVGEALEKTGAKLLFTGLNIRPGRSTTAALRKNKLAINLPGNPGGIKLLFYVLVERIIKHLQGMGHGTGPWLYLPLDGCYQPQKHRYLCWGELIANQGKVTARLLKKGEKPPRETGLVLDIEAGQGREGDLVRARLIP